MTELSVALVGLALANAAYWRGGLDQIGWNVSVGLIVAAAILARPRLPKGLVGGCLVLLPLFAAFQAVTHISVSPAVTWQHALRFLAYVLVFLVARNAILQKSAGWWLN